MDRETLKRGFFDWKKVFHYALPAMIIVSIIVIKVSRRQGCAEVDFVTAHNAFSKWDQVLEKRGEDFLHLKRLMRKHPELQSHYDSRIGQNLLALQDVDEANLYVERTLERTKQPYYSDYARTSLKISSRQYAEALSEARNLKEKLVKDEAFWRSGKEGSALFAFNLMRIATLCQELSDNHGELEAWKEIKRYGGWEEGALPDEKIGQAGFTQLLSHFTVQETTLLDYIQAREKDLKTH